MNEAPPTLRQCKVPNLAAVSPGPTFTVKASFGASRNIDLRWQKDYKSARISGDWTASTSPGHDPPLPATVRFLAERGTHLFCHLHIWESRRRASPHCFALWCQSSKVWRWKHGCRHLHEGLHSRTQVCSLIFPGALHVAVLWSL